MADASIRIRTLREHHHMSRDVFEEKLNVSRSTAQRYEDPADSAELSVAQINQIVAMFGSTHAYLCAGIEPAFQSQTILPKSQSEMIEILRSFGITTPDHLQKVLHAAQILKESF